MFFKANVKKGVPLYNICQIICVIFTLFRNFEQNYHLSHSIMSYQEQQRKLQAFRRKVRLIRNIILWVCAIIGIILFIIGWQLDDAKWLFIACCMIICTGGIACAQKIDPKEEARLRKRNSISTKKKDLSYLDWSWGKRFFVYSGFIAFVLGGILLGVGMFTLSADKEMAGFLPMVYGLIGIVYPCFTKPWYGGPYW